MLLTDIKMNIFISPKRPLSICGIAYHYPIYGDRSLIGRSPIALHFIVDTCTSLSRSLTLFSASRWHRRAGWRIAGPV